MHPAPSIIFFTSFSGIGFGMLIFLGLGLHNYTGLHAFVFFTFAYLFSVGGLISSTLHLGHPERALKAFSQWKSSWLSREGVAAVAALLVMAVYGFGLVFLETSWALLGWVGALLSLATVFTTSMIYSQLKSVPRWNMIPLTPALFFSFALTGGALMIGKVSIALFLLILTAVIQIAWWYLGDRRFSEAGSTLASATGLGTLGEVKAFEPPHTGNNYLLREMVHVVGRKHSKKLRVISFLLAFVAPILFLLLPFSHLLGFLAVLSHVIGLLTSRWLFFAEAEHVVGLYYGKR